MSRNYKPVDPKYAVKIRCLEKPKEKISGDGYYDLRWGDRPKEANYYDVITLPKELDKLMPKRTDDIMDRLQNFAVVYLNLKTGEITSPSGVLNV